MRPLRDVRWEVIVVRLARAGHSPSPLNPLGAKGTGEGSAVAGPAAVVNAVADALETAVDLTEIPLRPEAILKALRADVQSGDG